MREITLLDDKLCQYKVEGLQSGGKRICKEFEFPQSGVLQRGHPIYFMNSPETKPLQVKTLKLTKKNLLLY